MIYEIKRTECDRLFFDHVVTEDMQTGAYVSHTHSAYELLYVVNGDVTLTVEDRRYKLKKDDLAIIKPLDHHYVRIDAECEYDRYNFLFNPTALGINNIGALPEGLEVCNCRMSPILCELVKKTDYYKTHLSPESFEDIVGALIKELIYNLSIFSKQQTDAKHRSPSNPLISAALEVINAEINTQVSVSDIASKLFVTKSYLHRIFKSELGITPAKYILEKRILTARNMLLFGKLPTEVYSECGFSDYTSFYRAYVRYFGYPPSKERA